MRTTIALDDDAQKILRAHAKSRDIWLGSAASDLIRNGARYRLSTRLVNGLPVFDVPEGLPPVTEELVARLLDEA